MKKSRVLMYRLIWSVSVTLFLAMVAGCGGLDSGVKSPASALKGVFIDGPVGGINYSTPTFKGVTNAEGVFEYRAGETVTFSIGGLTLGSTTGKPVVTPMDIVPDAKNASDQRVVNICVVLQTLDQDGNPANGIMITEKTASFVTKYGMTTDFNKHVRKFSFDSGFRNVMAELNNIDAFGETPRAVKPPVVAQKHLEATLADLKKMETPDKK